MAIRYAVMAAIPRSQPIPLPHQELCTERGEYDGWSGVDAVDGVL